MNYQRMIEGMLKLKAGHFVDERKGICFNLAWTVDEKRGGSVDTFIAECFTHLFGKPLCSPVEGDIISYIENTRKWDKETDFGLRRWDLLDKMIAYAEQQLKGEEA